jgi:alpha-galactosidase
VRDILLSEALAERGVDIRLMDTVADHLTDIELYAGCIAAELDRNAGVTATTDLERALDGANFVVTAIEVDRFKYWAQDFHVPRKYGIRQVFGENGGPGGLFHALRNMGPTLAIADAMEVYCPGAPMLNYTNPEHKLVEAVSRLTSVPAYGLCHGVMMGIGQIARILEMDSSDLDTAACGINHLTWFTKIRNKRTGEDLYPKLREAERAGDWLSDWHEIGLGRILFRIYGLWPSPAANHYGEYIRWADEFVASELQFFHDPVDGNAWDDDVEAEWIYSLTGDVTGRPWKKAPPEPGRLEDEPLRASGEAAVPIMEALACNVRHRHPAVNVPNRGAIPNLPDDMVVEVPAVGDAAGLVPEQMEALPEGVAAMLRTQGSIHKLLDEAYSEGSKNKLLQALLLDPTVHSYRQAVLMLDEMLALQKDILPVLT